MTPLISSHCYFLFFKAINTSCTNGTSQRPAKLTSLVVDGRRHVKAFGVVLKNTRFYVQGNSNWNAGEDEAQIRGSDGMLVAGRSWKFKHSTSIDGQDDASQWLCVRVVPTGRQTGLLEEVTEPTSKYAEADLIGGSCIIREKNVTGSHAHTDIRGGGKATRETGNETRQMNLWRH